MYSTENLTLIWQLISLSLLPITVLYILYFRKMVKLLKLSHPDVYRELGEIGMIKNNSVSNSGKFIGFLIKRKYQRLDNKDLIKLGDVCRRLLIAGYIVFATVFIMPIIIGKYYS